LTYENLRVEVLTVVKMLMLVLGCNTLLTCRYILTFLRNILPPSSEQKRNACYHSVENILPSHLLSKNIKIKMYKEEILPAALYGCEMWSVMLREEWPIQPPIQGVEVGEEVVKA
jgi:hypothetical protein